MIPSTRDQFTIAIICALVEEANAVEALFDETYDRLSQFYGKVRGDRNAYLNGRIGKYDVVLCYMPNMGKGSAAMVASDLRFSYTKIQLALVVGVCGGVPKKSNGQIIFLGDTIISDSVIQYDLGQQYPNGFRRKRDVKDTLDRPSHELRALIAGLSGDRTRAEFQRKMSLHIQKIQHSGAKWRRPAFDDILFKSSYTHKHHKSTGDANCICSSGAISDRVCESALKTDCVTLGCEESQICRRRPQTDMADAVVHIGGIASADTVMKSGIHRDRLADTEAIIAFEMEGAGVWDNFPCIIIKGVCDYADSHKNSNWQLYAAANGAAAAKTLLEYLILDVAMVNPEAKIENRVHWMVPFRRNPKFVGRRNQIEQIRTLISDPNGPRELAITGLGGVGKTQVALEFAYQTRDADPQCSVLWIPCTSQENIEQAYAEIAQRLELPGSVDPKAKVKAYLSQRKSKKWILIFDNADSEYMWMKDKNALRDFVPDNEYGRILFTSRNGQLAIDLADSYIIKVDEFDVETGKEFLRRSLLQHDLLNDHNTVVRFLEDLSFLPLAIAQAAAYVNKNQINLSTYVGHLENQETRLIEVLSENFQDNWRYKDVQNPVATTWWISFQQIQDWYPLAAKYLSYMACINPRDIPQSMLPSASSKNEKIKAIGLLKSYAFVSDSEPAEDELLNLHRLVHVATRNWMRTKAMLEPLMLTIVDQLSTLFIDHQPRMLFSFPMPHEGKPLTQSLPHALALLREECIRSEQTKRNELMVGVITYLTESMRLEEAEDLCTQLIRYADKENDHDNIILCIMSLLARIYDLQERPQAKEEIVGQFLDKPTTMLLQDRLSMQLQGSSSATTEGSEKTEKATATIMETSEQEVVSALTSQDLLASLYAQLGRYKESENLYLRTIDNGSVILGPEHPMTLQYQASLAKVYCDSEQNMEAEDIYLHIVKTSDRARGPNHPDSMIYQLALANLYCNTGKHSDAEQIYLQVIERSKIIHGPDDIRTLNDQFHLARVYGYQKRYKDAEELMIHVIKKKQRMLGSKVTLDIIKHLSDLMELYGDWGEFNKRTELLTQFIQYRERLADELPLGHDFTKFAHAFMARSSLASLNMEMISLNEEMISLNEERMLLDEKMAGVKGKVIVSVLEMEKSSLEERWLFLEKRRSSLETERATLIDENTILRGMI